MNSKTYVSLLSAFLMLIASKQVSAKETLVFNNLGIQPSSAQVSSNEEDETNDENIYQVAVSPNNTVPLEITSSTEYPWIAGTDYVQSGNVGNRNTNSYLYVNYKSEYKTELSFEWMNT